MKNELKINEIFTSISGEVSPYHQGRVTTFVRFSGCVARCYYCDTPGNSEGFMVTTDRLIELIESKENNHICITGGEPLLQPEGVWAIVNRFRNVWIETSGLIDFRDYIGNVSLVVDWKLKPQLVFPYNRHPHKHFTDSYRSLTCNDFIKFVVGDRSDYHQVAGIVENLKNNNCKANIALSSVHNTIPYDLLFHWAVSLHADVIVNCQLHKIMNLK